MKIPKDFILKVSLFFCLSIASISFVYIENINKLHSNLINLEKINTDLIKENEKIAGSNKELEISIDTINKYNLILSKEMEYGGFKKEVHYNSSNITEPSNATYEQLKYALQGTKLEGYVKTFIQVEEEYNINALFMIGIVANESSWLNSNRAVTQNNVTGYAVYSNSSQGKDFSSIEESILETAKLLSTEYTSENGKHYNGVSASDINIKYSSAEDWDTIVDSISTEMKNKINVFTKFLYN